MAAPEQEAVDDKGAQRASREASRRRFGMNLSYGRGTFALTSRAARGFLRLLITCYASGFATREKCMKTLCNNKLGQLSRGLIFLVTAVAMLTFASVAPAVASATATAHSRNSPILGTAGQDTCKPASAGSSSIKQCVRVQRIKVSQLNAAERSRRKSALAKTASQPGAGGHAPVSTSPIPRAAGPALSYPPQCGFVDGAVPNPDRFTSCEDLLWEVVDYQVNPDETITVVGQFDLEDFQWISFSGGPSWTHGLTLFAYAGTGTLSDGFTTNVISACSNIPECSAAPSDPQTITVTSSSSYDFEWLETDTNNTAPGEKAYLLLGVIFEGNDDRGSFYSDDDGLLDGRCDTIATSTDGCVDEGYIPTLELSSSKYGAAANMIEWAQGEMSAHWGEQGAGSPLTYLGDKAATNVNRQIICDSTFVNQGTAIGGDDGSSDSCDEFPFAATYQSGAQNGVTSGEDCAQITAAEIPNPTGILATDWSWLEPLGSPTGNEACVRGHTPLDLNTGVGSAYGTFITTERLIDEDRFWVEIID